MLPAVLVVALLACALFIGWRKFAHGVRYSGDLAQLKGPLVIFDFDGTICPSFDLFIHHLNALSKTYGYKKIEEEEKETFKNLTAREGIKKLGVSSYQLPFLVHHIRSNSKEELLNLSPIPGMASLLHTLKTEQVQLGILTSNAEENVRLYLKKYGLDCIDFIYAGNHVFSKHQHLKKILKKTKLSPHEVLFVGDEVRDMEGARQASISGIAVSWGYNSPALLQQRGAPHLCFTLDDLTEQLLQRTKR